MVPDPYDGSYGKFQYHCGGVAGNVKYVFGSATVECVRVALLRALQHVVEMIRNNEQPQPAKPKYTVTVYRNKDGFADGSDYVIRHEDGSYWWVDPDGTTGNTGWDESILKPEYFYTIEIPFRYFKHAKGGAFNHIRAEGDKTILVLDDGTELSNGTAASLKDCLDNVRDGIYVEFKAKSPETAFRHVKYSKIYQDGFEAGKEEAWVGAENAFDEGYEVGHQEGFDEGTAEGYLAGLQKAKELAKKVGDEPYYFACDVVKEIKREIRNHRARQRDASNGEPAAE